MHQTKNKIPGAPAATCAEIGKCDDKPMSSVATETAFNLPTLNMSFFHKVQLGQTQNPCFLTIFNSNMPHPKCLGS